MSDEIVKRIVREARLGRALDTLGGKLSASDLQSLLLSVFRKRAAAVTPARLLRAYEENRFVAPSIMDPETSLKLDLLAFSLLPEGFHVLELSPVAPLATCSAVAPVDQNRLITTTRNTEVVSDATNVLALEAALRRRAMQRADPRARERVRLCASHRHMRTQQVTDKKFTAHFKVVCLVTAGRDEGQFRFEAESLVEHIDFYVRFLERVLPPGEGWLLEGFVSDFAGGLSELLTKRVIKPLRELHPRLSLALDPERPSARNYYAPVCFNIRLRRGPGGEATHFLADGGLVDWTRRLLGSKKERLMTSGIGTELLSKVVSLKLP